MKKNENNQWKFEQEPEYNPTRRDIALLIAAGLLVIIGLCI